MGLCRWGAGEGCLRIWGLRAGGQNGEERQGPGRFIPILCFTHLGRGAAAGGRMLSGAAALPLRRVVQTDGVSAAQPRAAQKPQPFPRILHSS